MASLNRRRIACLALLVVALAPWGSAAPAGAQQGSRPFKTSVVPRADAVADLDALFRSIESIHPDPYWSRSRESVESDRQRLVATLPDTMTLAEWWIRLSPLVASLGDGHTEITPPEGQSGPSEALERDRPFPRGVGLDDAGHLLVTSAGRDTGGLQRGDRILAINGRSADGLVADWIRETSGDTEPHRAVSVIDRFPALLSIHSIEPPYTLTVAGAGGGARTVALADTPAPPVVQARPRVPVQPNFAYRVLEPGVGYMNFYAMGGDWSRFTEAVAGMFRQVAADSARTLIVDLRVNGGGDPAFGNEVLRYVTSTPYRNRSRREVKRSRELRDFAKSEISAPLRILPLKYLVPDARRLYAGAIGTLAVWPEPPLRTPKRAEPFFDGRVCVLTGPRTFSAAVILADTIKTYRLAALVGEETGGRPNMYGEWLAYALPRSGLVASIATARSVRANGNAGDRTGVIPDIVVKTTATDIRAGRDPVLARARDCPAVHG